MRSGRPPTEEEIRETDRTRVAHKKKYLHLGEKSYLHALDVETYDTTYLHHGTRQIPKRKSHN